MTELTFLRDLAVVMAVSAVTTILFHVLRQPTVLGYIVAGVIVGPYTPPFALVEDLHSIHTLAELGILLLLFSIGLEFDLKKLRRVGGVAVLTANLEILLMLWLGYTAGQLLGWSKTDSLFLGAILSISSTTIITQVLLETRQLRETFAQIILGILIVEDIAAILILVLLSGLAGAGTIAPTDVGWALLQICLFMATAIVLGLFFIPRLLGFVASFGRGDMLTITVLGLAFGLAALGSQFGFSIALGAFLMGAIIAESKEANQIVERISPIREMFTAVFFVATGMLFDPAQAFEFLGPIFFVAAITVVGKILSCSFGTFLAGHAGEIALPVGLGMAQIGEFSFIIAKLGRTSGVTSGALFPIAVAVSSVTTLLTPYLLRSARPIAATATRLSPRPLVTFATFYTAWVSRLTTRTNRSERKIQRLFFRLILYLAVTVALFVVTWSTTGPLVSALPRLLPRQREVLQWLSAGVVVLPFLFLIGRTLQELIHDATYSLYQHDSQGGGEPRIIRDAFLFLFGWIAAVFVLAAGSPVLPPLVPLSIVILGLLVTTVLFWESLVRFHKHIDSVLSTLGTNPASEESPASSPEWQGRQEVTRLLSDRYGPEVQTEDFVVPLQPTPLNRTLKSLGLRSLTGASIIAIYRDPEQVLVPQAETVLLPGDVLVFLGEKEELEAAVKHLSKLASQTSAGASGLPEAGTLRVPSGSPFAGRTVAEIALREEVGVLIVGVKRGEQRVANPDPEFRIEEGDELHLWGPLSGIEEAQRRCRPA